MKASYLLIDIAIVIIPLLFSFDRKIQYYKRWPPLALSILLVGSSFILWDIVATGRGDWGFSEDYTLGLRILGLPFEEILFFIVVPYSCLFIYEALKYYLKQDVALPSCRWIHGAIALLFFIAAFWHRDQAYTYSVLNITGLFFLICALSFTGILKSRHYWLYIVISFIPFVIFNYFLTAPPIVYYSPTAIWGLRILTIPVEDFIYNYSLLSYYFLVYATCIHHPYFRKNK